jgi:hypothetical protein
MKRRFGFRGDATRASTRVRRENLFCLGSLLVRHPHQVVNVRPGQRIMPCCPNFQRRITAQGTHTTTVGIIPVTTADTIAAPTLLRMAGILAAASTAVGVDMAADIDHAGGP